ncbi:hypothetical protein HPB50_026650 [Hyalomma asiaticum]|uniref:Uncharacterized protein n=1 Tax=Hyalomma asiaticum TaxID=266040 RepID=A0ACB7S1N0_HYAAI|nr:hypothetical protein HPB50_026650 [Hyalomma asiaticum]
MIRRVSASAASTDARSFAADDRSRRLDDRERAVETRRSELLTVIMALVFCCTKSRDACDRSGEHFYTIPADNSQAAARAGERPSPQFIQLQTTHPIKKQPITRESSARAISHQNAEIVDRSNASNRPELASAMALPC